MCEGLQTMSHNLKSLAELSERQENLQSQCEGLEKEMEDFRVNLEQEVARVLARTSYVIRGPKKPATLDSPGQEVEEALLPPPLLPSTSPIPPVIASESSSTPTVSPSHLPSSDLTDAPPTLPPPLLPTVGLAPSPQPTLAAYVGFSAQASSIPSISCSTAATDRLLSSPASFTPSDTSSSVNSPLDSPVRCPAVEE